MQKRDTGAQPAFVKLTPLNRKGACSIKPGDPQEGSFNYFVGNDASGWRKNITTYDAVTCQDVYPGIDLVFYAGKGHLEYDIVIKSGVDFSHVAFECGGVERLETTDEGDLIMHLAGEVASSASTNPSSIRKSAANSQAVEGFL